MQVPSTMGTSVEERRMLYKKALRRERMMMVIDPIKRALPEYLEGIMALMTCVGIVAAIIAVMAAIA